MKDFFNKYSYGIVRMFRNQMVIAMFGLMLSMAAMQVKISLKIPEDKVNSFAVAVSILAIIFYLFLIYTLSWEIGAKDRVSTDTGRNFYNPHRGLVLSVLANSVNFLIAIFFVAVYPFASAGGAAQKISGVLQIAGSLINGMYFGIITEIQIGGANLNALWPTFFLLPIPAMLTAWAAYYFGHKNKRFTSLFVYKEPKRKK